MHVSACLQGLVPHDRWVHLHPASLALVIAALAWQLGQIQRVPESEVPAHPVLRARCPFATWDGARVLASRDGESRTVRDQRAVLIDEVPDQHEATMDVVEGCVCVDVCV